MEENLDHLDINPDVLKRRYAEEREKRISSGSARQCIPIEEQFPAYLDDPYVEHPIARAKVVEDVDVVIIGAGFGGLVLSTRLQEAAITNFRIIDRAADVGGTWYWNRYPGAQCDTESYIYLPLLEEVGYVPSEKYSHGPEIFQHARAIARKFSLYERSYLQTEVTGLRWNDARRRWVVATDRGDKIFARFVTISAGPVSKPKLPNIPGIEKFNGHAFHTSRWDYKYSGGTAEGGLVGLKDKRVGIIGTGATAIQCIPHLGRDSGKLFVFQRTPSSVLPRFNRPTDPNWAATLPPGWQRHRMENFNILVSGGHQDEDLVGDGWTELFRDIGKELTGVGQDTERRQMLDFQKMEMVRRRVDQIVDDKAAADALKPYYNLLCKRPAFHDEYLQTFNLPNVQLVDAKGGVERVTEKGVVVEGREYELDCLIYATGFEFMTPFSQRSGYDIIGRKGLSLTEKWADGVSTMHGLFNHGFPNCFLLCSIQSAYSHNFTYMIDEQSRHVAYVIRNCLDNKIDVVEPSAEAEKEWVDHLKANAHIKLKFDRECTPGYLNFEGQASEKTALNNFYPLGPVRFLEIIHEWRKDGTLKGLVKTPAETMGDNLAEPAA